MKRSKIITVEGLTIDLSKIKAIKISNNTGAGDVSLLVVDLYDRYEYIFNPNANEHQPIYIKDSVEMKYLNYSVAADVADTIQMHWQEYLDLD